MLDVVVIGGGPVGSWAAYKLATMGHRVAVLEKKEKLGHKSSCTGIISQECMAGLPDISPVIFAKVNSAKVYSPEGEYMRVYHPQTQAYIVDRSKFDIDLGHRAQTSGVDYYMSTEAISIAYGSEGVLIETMNNRKSRSLNARSVILASGFNSSLVARAGLGRSGVYARGAQTTVNIKDLPEVEVYLDQSLAPGYFAWLVPTSEGRGLMGLLSRSSPAQLLQDWIIRLEKQGRIEVEKRQISQGGIPMKPLERTYKDRLLVVGDAAGQVKPTTGGGIYFGLISAGIAANTLHKSLVSESLSARHLALYEKEWKKKLGSEIRREYLARRIYQSLDNRKIEYLFSGLKTSGLVESILEKGDISFDWHGNLVLKVIKHILTNGVNNITGFWGDRMK